MNDMQQDAAPGPSRNRSQRVGLVLGIFAFAAALFWPDLPGLKEQVAQALSVPADHPDVLNVARGAQATLALTLLMVVWWTTEAVPIAITALLPGLMLPCLQVSGIKDGSVFGFTSTAAFSGYANPVIYLFLAGFLLAGGMRKSGLDLRVTLTFLTRKYAARGPATLLLTMMATTAFLSMWISNTATTAMMLPIAVGVLAAFGEQPGTSRFGSAMMLGIAWSASIGGIATVIGSPPNGIVVGILSEQGLADIGFGRWMTFGLPVSISGVLAAWLVLLLIFRPRTGKSNSARAALHRQKQALGAWSRDEIFTVIIVLMVAALWITQPFWKYALPGSVVSRVSGIGVYEIGLACSLLLFVLPVDLKTWRSVLDWGDSKFVDWGTLLLFGGGIALSTAMFRTGLTEWLAGGLINYFGTATPWVSLIVVVLLVDFLTEITSNTAVTAMMAPILISLAPHLNLDPLLLCVVAAMASSLAFMLPVATPPNALVYATGYFRIGQMMRAGFLMNLTGCATLMAVIYLLSGLLFP